MDEEPILLILNLRDGPWGKTLRVRKGLQPTRDFRICKNDDYKTLLSKVRQSLPGPFDWNERKEPLRYQRNREQPQSTLEPIFHNTNFFKIFSDLRIKSRRRNSNSAQQEFSVQIWVFGIWALGILGTPPDGIHSQLNQRAWIESNSHLNMPDRHYSLEQMPCHSLEPLGENSRQAKSNGMYIEPRRQSIEHLSKKPRIIPNNCGCLDCENDKAEPEFDKFDSGTTQQNNREEKYVSLQVMFNGVRMPLDVEISSLRAALGLNDNFEE